MHTNHGKLLSEAFKALEKYGVNKTTHNKPYPEDQTNFKVIIEPRRNPICKSEVYPAFARPLDDFIEAFIKANNLRQQTKYASIKYVDFNGAIFSLDISIEDMQRANIYECAICQREDLINDM